MFYNRVFTDDLEMIANSKSIPWTLLKDKTIFVTGATGLIGFSLVSGLLYAGKEKNISLKIIALVRDVKKAEKRFRIFIEKKFPLYFVEGDLSNIPKIMGDIDFIIHGASPTASRYFVEFPVETIQTNIQSAIALLNLAREKEVQSFLYLSSMEVYGGNQCQKKIDETHESFVDTMNPRSSYPEAKRIVEALCAGYASEYGVHAKVIRLTQTFGAGIRLSENRVFAQFMNSAMNHRDIVLFTKGQTKHSYLYTADAVTAILTVLLKGQCGEAYNAANESTYCSIREMANLVANLEIINNEFNGPVNVKINEIITDNKIYPPESFMDLNTKKIQELDWRPMISLEEAFTRMIRYIKDVRAL